MAVNENDIVQKYKQDITDFISCVEPKLDEYLLHNYKEIITNGDISISLSEIAKMRNNSDFLPKYLRLGLVNILSQTYIDWHIKMTVGNYNNKYLYFTPPKTLLDKLKNSKTEKKQEKVEDKIEEVNDRAEIIDI